MKWEELAWELLQAPAQDAVRLAFADSAEVLEVLGKLDLRALVECERKPGGFVRVKLADRMALLAALVKAGFGDGGDDTEKAAAFFRALDEAASTGREEG